MRRSAQNVSCGGWGWRAAMAQGWQGRPSVFPPIGDRPAPISIRTHMLSFEDTCFSRRKKEREKEKERNLYPTPNYTLVITSQTLLMTVSVPGREELASRTQRPGISAGRWAKTHGLRGLFPGCSCFSLYLNHSAASGEVSRSLPAQGLACNTCLLNSSQSLGRKGHCPY